MNEKKITRNNVDKVGVFFSNLAGTFWETYRPLWNNNSHGPTPGEAMVMAVHTALLPVTMTLGAGIKTVTDIKSRHPLTDQEMTALLNCFKNNDEMTDKQFDDCIKTILAYPAKSKPSQQLIADLQSASATEKYQLAQNLQIEKVTLFKQEFNEFKDKLSPHDQQFLIDIPEVTEKTTLTPANQAVFDDRKTTIRTDVAKDRRQSQSNLIFEYLSLTENVGKKMQHVIADAVTASGCTLDSTQQLHI